MKASIEGPRRQPGCLPVILVQLVSLLRDASPSPCHPRAGEYVDPEQVIDEVGKDAARYNSLIADRTASSFRSGSGQEQSNENPVYYVQYAQCPDLEHHPGWPPDRGWTWPAGGARRCIC